MSDQDEPISFWFEENKAFVGDELVLTVENDDYDSSEEKFVSMCTFVDGKAYFNHMDGRKSFIGTQKHMQELIKSIINDVVLDGDIEEIEEMNALLREHKGW